MLEIINGVNISYTQGDTFRLKISSGNGFNEGSKVRLVVARDETGSAVISNAYDIGADGAFYVVLGEEDKAKLAMGDYLYKLVLLAPDGSVVTQKSGDFMVKWGA